MPDRTRALLATALLATPLALAAPAAASSQWRFEPAAAPPPPPGAAPSPYRVALGPVGDIEFWSRNRGLLITAGTQGSESAGVVPMGVYAWNGVDWHQLSTVCGGSDGRIAWAGPQEFWTIADQRPGQVTGQVASLRNLSLCHFKDGVVVGSYAMPLDQPGSYRPMNAAVCRAADDCWFGGARALPPARGGFHLHWDGSELRAIWSPQDHAIADMAAVGPQLYESVALAAGDDRSGEDPDHPPVLHTVGAASAATPFRNVVPSDPTCAEEVVCPPLPDYGTGAGGLPADPATLDGFRLGGDWTLAGGPGVTPQLWAVAGPKTSPSPDPAAGYATGRPLVLRLSGGAWAQVVPRLASLPAGTRPVAVAAEPGAGAAWVALAADGDQRARLVRLTAGGDAEPADLGPAQGVGARGAARAVACPAPGDCWVATDRGWLFHLTDGAPLARDDSPAFAGVIDERPADAGVPFTPSDDLPPDDSLANQPKPPAPGPAVDPPARRAARRTRPRPAKPLVSGRPRSRLVRGTTLRMTFTLTGRAHVQIVALRRGKVVGRSRRATLRAGRRALELRLDRRRWPTKVDLRARPAR